MGIMQRRWTQDDECELAKAIDAVRRLKNKKELIGRLQRGKGDCPEYKTESTSATRRYKTKYQ